MALQWGYCSQECSLCLAIKDIKTDGACRYPALLLQDFHREKHLHPLMVTDLKSVKSCIRLQDVLGHNGGQNHNPEDTKRDTVSEAV